MILVPPRSHAAEIMDRPDNPVDELSAALRDIRAVNRLLGGSRALVDAVRPLLLSSDARPLTLLDVGTGSADLPLELLRLAKRIGRPLRVTAIDRDPRVAAVAATRCREHAEIRIVRADAFDPPFLPGAFDIVTASMFLHHFTHSEIVRLLGRFTALARRAVIVNDLRRHRLPWLAVLLISRATRRSAMFNHDAPLSVLRGFTDEELGRAARDAGSGRFVVRRRWPFRLVLTLQGEAAA